MPVCASASIIFRHVYFAIPMGDVRIRLRLRDAILIPSAMLGQLKSVINVLMLILWRAGPVEQAGCA
jgi:hypothetical protein